MATENGKLRFEIEADGSQVVGKAEELARALRKLLQDAQRVENTLNKMFSGGSVQLKAELSKLREFNRAINEIAKGGPDLRITEAHQKAVQRLEQVAERYQRAYNKILGIDRKPAQKAKDTLLADIMRQESVDFERLQKQREAQGRELQRRFNDYVKQAFQPSGRPAVKAQDTLLADILRKEQRDFELLQKQRDIQGRELQRRFNDYIRQVFQPSGRPAQRAQDTLLADMLRQEQRDFELLQKQRELQGRDLQRRFNEHIRRMFQPPARPTIRAKDTVFAEILRKEEEAARQLERKRLELQKRMSRSLQSLIDSSLGITRAPVRSAHQTLLADQLRKEEQQFGLSDITQRVISRIKANGGGDFLELQGRLMLNFQLLAGAYRSVTFLTGFVRDLDAELRQFQAITASSNAEMARLEERLISVSEKFKFTAVEVAQAATVMAQAGFSTREIEDSAEAIALLATATGTDLKTTVDTITSVLGVFDLQASEATNVANTLTAAINETKLTMDKLALGIQYASNIAKQAGITYVELTAILGGLANAGIRAGSTLGTGVRQLLIELQGPTRKFLERLESIGLNRDDIDIQTQGFVGVLKNLTEAGFTAADAMEVFEVRSAAAFSAISNNLDTIIKLERTLLLSSAAAEANKVQMESLANTWAKFQSVAGTVAFRSFRPVLETLQEITDAFADNLALLNRYPNVASVAGTALAGVVTTVVLTKFVKLIGYVVGLRNEALTLSGAMNLLSSSTFRLSSAMALLARSGPFLLLSTAISTLIFLFGNASRELAGLEDQIDRSRSKVRDFEGSVETINNTITAVTEAIESLAKQSTNLEKDQDLLENKILEMKVRFAEYGFEINKTAHSVEGLIDALQNLRQEQISLRAVELAGLEAEKRRLIELQRRALAQTASGSFFGDDFAKRFGVRREVIQSEDEFGELPLPVTPTQIDTRLAQLYGPEVARIFRVITSGQAIENFDLQDILQGQGVVKQALQRETRALAEASPEEAAQIQARIKGLEVLLDRIQKVAAEFTDLMKLRTEEDNLQNQLLTTQIELQPEAQQAKNLAEDLRAKITAGLLDIFKQSLDPEARLEAIKEFRATLDEDFKTLDTLIDALKGNEGLVSEYGAEKVRKAVDAIGFDTSKKILENLILKRIEVVNEDLEGILEDENKHQQSVYKKEIQALLSRIRNEDDPKAIEALKQTIDQNLEQLKELRFVALESFEDLKGATLTRRQIQVEREIATERERIDETVRDRLEAIAEAEQRAAEAVAEEVTRQRLAALKDELRVIRQRLRGEKDPAVISDLRQQGMAILEEMRQIRLEAIENFSDATGEMLELKKRALERESAAEKAQLEETVHQVFEQIRKSVAELQIQVLEDQRDELLQRMRDLKSRLSIAKTPEQIVELEAQYRNLSSQALALENQIIRRQSSAVLTSARGFKPSANAGEAQAAIITLAQAAGIDPRLALAIASLETGRTFDPKAQNPFSGALGVFQFLPSTFRSYGVAPTTDLETQVRLGTDFIRRNIEALRRKLGREPSFVEVYLAHWLGVGGAVALLKADPNAKALEVLRRTGFYASPEKVLAQNGLDLSASVSDVIANRGRMIDSHLNFVQQFLDEGLNQEIYEARVRSQYQAKVEEFNKELAGFGERMIDLHLKAIEDAFSRSEEEINLRTSALDNRFNRDRIGEIQRNMIAESAEIEREALLLERLNRLKELQAQIEDKIQQIRQSGQPKTAQLITLEEKLAIVTQNLAAAQREYLAATMEIAEAPLIELIEAAINQWSKQAGLFKSMNTSIAEGIQNVLEHARTGFTDMFEAVRNGSKSAAEAFKDFGLSVLDTISKIAVQMAAQKIFGLLLDAGLSAFGISMGGAKTMHAGGLVGAPGGMVKPVLATAFAGAPRFHAGGYLAPDEVPAILQRGEFVLNRSAVEAIGVDQLRNLNSLGQRPQEGEEQASPGVINIWIVDKESAPPPGPNDIVAAVVDNGRRGGPIKQLIKSIQLGVV